ncbi:MAG: NCS2 family permease, partial [Cyanobacteria bacterium P01_C01_bin.72]
LVVNLLLGIAAWGALIAKNALRVAGLGTIEQPFTPELLPIFEQLDIYISGAFALEQGLIFTAMILAAMTVFIIEREFAKAALWSLLASFLAWIGLMHSYQWSVGDTVLNLGWGVGSEWAVGYIFLSLLLLYAQWQKRSSK